ncbi:MAG: transcription termination factor Rho, partial [Planctomycetes bacterium]|nr:transcription termination factor Rho [Planctomycetota bacterium]
MVNQKGTEHFKPSNIPSAPSEEWVQKSVKTFATKKKKADLQFNTYLNQSLPDLQDLGEKIGIEDALGLSRAVLMRRIVRTAMEDAGVFFVRGTLDVTEFGFGFLRHKCNDFTESSDVDILVHPGLIEKHHLLPGQVVRGVMVSPADDEGLFVMHEVLEVFGDDPEKQWSLEPFHDLVPLYPEERLGLETEADLIETRIIDLISPIGKGQRGLIVAPPRAGKTVLLQMIANAITKLHSDSKLIILLVDERPEEVTDMQRSVKGEVVSSTFDEPATRHVAVSEMVIEKAKRLVEHKRDVVILLDSITRLGRAFNTVVPSSGKVLTGGVDANALQRPKRFFGAARNIEEGGSLTIIATALIDTGSRMDEVIFEEFKGTGNSEIVLDRKVADKRVFPAMDVLK